MKTKKLINVKSTWSWFLFLPEDPLSDVRVVFDGYIAPHPGEIIQVVNVQRIAELENQLGEYAAAEANDPKTWPTVLKQMKRITELEAELQEQDDIAEDAWSENEKLEAEIERLTALADERGKRMELMRKVLDDLFAPNGWEWVVTKEYEQWANWFNEDGNVKQ